MTTINIHFDDGSMDTVVLTPEAEEAIRFKFNPSALPTVNSIKALSGAFLSYLKEVETAKPEAGRELAVAKTNMQTASMWAVLGATKGL